MPSSLWPWRENRSPPLTLHASESTGRVATIFMLDLVVLTERKKLIREEKTDQIGRLAVRIYIFDLPHADDIVPPNLLGLEDSFRPRMKCAHLE
jgi:hypothetical protein